jgi:hypothetical protein
VYDDGRFAGWPMVTSMFVEERSSNIGGRAWDRRPRDIAATLPL